METRQYYRGTHKERFWFTCICLNESRQIKLCKIYFFKKSFRYVRTTNVVCTVNVINLLPCHWVEQIIYSFFNLPTPALAEVGSNFFQGPICDTWAVLEGWTNNKLNLILLNSALFPNKSTAVALWAWCKHIFITVLIYNRLHAGRTEMAKGPDVARRP